MKLNRDRAQNYNHPLKFSKQRCTSCIYITTQYGTSTDLYNINNTITAKNDDGEISFFFF